jgi:hypothetical protein
MNRLSLAVSEASTRPYYSLVIIFYSGLSRYQNYGSRYHRDKHSIARDQGRLTYTLHFPKSKPGFYNYLSIISLLSASFMMFTNKNGILME